MECRECGATIADRAIVCYRCGAPTAIPEPATKKRPGPARRAPAAVSLVLIVVAAVLAYFAVEAPAESSGQIAFGVLSGLSLLGGGYLLLRRRR